MIALEEESKLTLVGQVPRAATLRPWERDRQLVSLLEIMEEIQPDWVFTVFWGLGGLSAVETASAVVFKDNLKAAGPDLIPDDFRSATIVTFRKIIRYCRAAGLIGSEATAEKVLELLDEPTPTNKQLAKLCNELAGRLTDEAERTLFLSLSLREAREYNKPRQGWKKVVKKFQSTVRDIEDASRCLALERNTACVFHLMRIAEVGLRALGVALNDPTLDPKRNPSWETILHRCDTELRKPLKDRSPEWHTDEAFFSTATGNLRAVKDAWRNPTMHVEQHYDAKEAREIYAAVRAFMRHLASKLSE
jgi:hypothetical protein